MKKFLIAVMALLLSGCVVSSQNMIEATIRNDTTMPLTIKVATPLGPTTVVIQPGQTWSGSVNRRLIFSPVQIVVESPTTTK